MHMIKLQDHFVLARCTGSVGVKQNRHSVQTCTYSFCMAIGHSGNSDQQ